MLAQILDRASPLPATTAEDGGELEPGRIYVAPPDRHLMVADGRLCLSVGPRENGHRPAVDPLLRSLAAEADAPIGVILSGTRDDGTQGLQRIKAAGGVALVQDPREALYDGMPRSAIANVPVDAVLPAAKLAHHLVHLVREPHAMTDAPDNPGRPALEELADDFSATRYTCPDCGGALWRSEEGTHSGSRARSATRTRPTRSTASRLRSWRARCGRRPACSATAPRCSRRWPSAPSATATTARRRCSRRSARTPSSRR